MRGPMNPGESPQRTGVLPRRSSSAACASTVASAVPGPATTSTSGMMCAGLSQCTARKRSGAFTASTRCFGEIVELPLAMIASSSSAAPSRANVSRFRSSSSGSASCTKPTPRSPSSPTWSSMRASAASTCARSMTSSSAMSAEIARDLAPRVGEHTPSPRAGERGLRSTSRTRHPPSANAARSAARSARPEDSDLIERSGRTERRAVRCEEASRGPTGDPVRRRVPPSTIVPTSRPLRLRP